MYTRTARTCTARTTSDRQTVTLTHLLNQPHPGSVLQLVLQRTDDHIKLIFAKHIALGLFVGHNRGRALGVVHKSQLAEKVSRFEITQEDFVLKMRALGPGSGSMSAYSGRFALSLKADSLSYLAALAVLFVCCHNIAFPLQAAHGAGVDHVKIIADFTLLNNYLLRSKRRVVERTGVTE